MSSDDNGVTPAAGGWWFPDEEPSVPSCYVDCWHPTIFPGYSVLAAEHRVLSLSRTVFLTVQLATERFTQLLTTGERLASPVYFTASYWLCFVTKGAG